MSASVIITGLGLELPGLADPAALLQPGAAGGPGEFVPERALGAKGLRFKDRATQLALCAARSALEDAGLPTTAATQLDAEALGIVASSNLGNVDTVCRAVETIRSSSVNHTSPLDLPNASSNIVASTLAIRFGCRSVNLMVCSGATSGTDALYLAANVIRARRARRMVVVGVEPRNAVVERLMRESARGWLGESAGELRLAEGAAAIVLESRDAARERGARIEGSLSGYGAAPGMELEPGLAAALNGAAPPVALWLTPNRAYRPTADAVRRAWRRWTDRPPARVDVSAPLGELYGALGIVQCVAACVWFRNHDGDTALATSGASWNDGSASLLIRRGAS
jgi:3-oxoacyl-[acyl-carrier-protein] synthase II